MIELVLVLPVSAEALRSAGFIRSASIICHVIDKALRTPKLIVNSLNFKSSLDTKSYTNFTPQQLLPATLDIQDRSIHSDERNFGNFQREAGISSSGSHQ